MNLVEKRQIWAGRDGDHTIKKYEAILRSERLREGLICVTAIFRGSSNPHAACFIHSAESAVQANTAVTGPKVFALKQRALQ